MKALSLPEASNFVCLDSGLSCGSRIAQPTSSLSHQAHIELNLIKSGLVTYLYGGNKTQVGVGRLATFWSAIPHQIVGASNNAEFIVMTLPLTWFLQFRLPEQFTHQILEGQVLVEPQVSPRGDYEMFEQWIDDLKSPRPGSDRIVLLEVEARLLRFAGALTAQHPGLGEYCKAAPVCDAGSADRIRQMLFFIAQNYTEQITVELIGKSAGLHPNYAMSLFRRTFGTTLTNYVTRYRLSHAQHLLSTTPNKIVDVALSSGFNSLSRFNDAFKRGSGCSPREYRDRTRNVVFN
jgi:AraC-like DNA-binding protein